MKRSRWTRWTSWLVFSLATAVVLSFGGAAAVAKSQYANASGGVVTFAGLVANPPSYILPLMSGQFESNSNLFYLQQLLFRPLYWFGPNSGTYYNHQLSLGHAPVYSGGGRTVTITLNHYKWADGQPVTNRDVEFWMNEIIANEANWFGFVPGGFPSNVVRMSYPKANPYQFSITFNKAYNHAWLLANELSQITPIPQHAWDRTSVTGSVGNYDFTAAGAIAVFKFLSSQAQLAVTYTTNPLWKVVDGPWELASFIPSTGYCAFVPNPNYSGPVKPRIAKLEEIPFTSDQAEFDALRSGELDYGFLPIQDFSQRSLLAREGYQFHPWYAWGFNWFPLNYDNPSVGPIFKQLYIRQAMQRLINQPAIIKGIFQGGAYPTYGPVPTHPASNLISYAESHNPYPYSVHEARLLLTNHGWSVPSGGVATCQRPGAGSGDCGTGIRKGARLNFSMRYDSGSITFSAMMQAIRSSWSQAGINLVMTEGPEPTVAPPTYACEPATHKGCGWEIADWGNAGYAWTYSPDFYPTGGELFGTGSGANDSHYSNRINDANIASTHLEQGLASFYAYENYAARNLPVLWQPGWATQFSEISSKLHGAIPQDPNLHITPENWTLSK